MHENYDENCAPDAARLPLYYGPEYYVQARTQEFPEGGGQFGSRGKSLWARSAQSEGAKRPSNCRGVRGYPPPGNFEKMRLFKTILSIPGVILEVFFRPQYF